jgi:hypothetical protein
MNTNDEDILNTIVQLRGQCCNPDRCYKCPFLDKCMQHLMRDYKLPYIDAKKLRLRMALDVLTDTIIVGDV